MRPPPRSSSGPRVPPPCSSSRLRCWRPDPPPGAARRAKHSPGDERRTQHALGRTCSPGPLRHRSPARYAFLRCRLPPRSCCASSARAGADADGGETQLAFKALLQTQPLREGVRVS